MQPIVSGQSHQPSFTLPPGGQWHNHYHPADLLGWPLTTLGPEHAYNQDHRVRSGRLPVGRVLASHLA